MKGMLNQIKYEAQYNNKLFLVIWVVLTAPMIRKIIYGYIIINCAAFIKFVVIISKKKNLNLNKTLDNIILKWVIVFQNSKTWNERFDVALVIILGYFIILCTPFSLKSIQFSIVLYNEIKISIFLLKKIKIIDSVKRIWKREFFVKNFNAEKIYILNVGISVTPHSNSNV